MKIGESPTQKHQKVFHRLVVSLFLILTLVLVGWGVYYYMTRYRYRDKFGFVENEVDSARYQSLGFKKVRLATHSGVGELSFFIPSEWAVFNSDPLMHGDVLSGSNIFVHSYPNSLGVLSDSVCDELGKDVESKFKSYKLYSESQDWTRGIEKIGPYRGCVVNASVNIAFRNYDMKHIFIFRKSRVYQISLLINEELPAAQDVVSMIMNSFEISD